jgi:adenylate kinase
MGDELKAVAAAATADATAAASPAPVTDAAAAAAAGSSVAPAPAPLLPAADAAAVAAALSAGDLVSSETAVVVLSAAIRARAAQGQRSLLVSGFPRGEADRAAWERAHAGVLSPAAIVVVAADAAAADAVLASRAEPPAVVAAKRAAWTAQSEPLLAAAEAEPGAGGVVRVPGVSADRGVAVVANAVRRALLGAGAPLTAGVPEVETTYAMIKPDAVAAGYTDAILERIRAAGFSIAARQDLTLPEETAKAFYAEHKARPFYTTLVQFMTSGPIVALALRRRGAILAWRKLAGPTNSHRARAIAPNSLRATFGVDGSFNAVHGSDSRVAANRELQLVFGEALPVGLLNPLRGYRLVLAGGPASGKGTQAELLRDALGVVHISTGELLRDEKKSGSTLGLKAAEYAEKGQLVPDDVMIPLVLQRVTQPDCARRGWLLDGFPRTAAQAKALRDAGLTADVCVVISVPDEVLVERVAGRVMCTKTGTIYHEKFNPPPPGVRFYSRLRPLSHVLCPLFAFSPTVYFRLSSSTPPADCHGEARRRHRGEGPHAHRVF